VVEATVSKARLWTALLAVWIVWGSTYLAIRFVVEALPALLAAGTRFVVAGSILFAWAWLRQGERPRAREWGPATVVGGFLLLGGNGAVMWAEQRVPSGLAALLVAIVPLWIVVLEMLRRGGTRPGRRTLGGVALGLCGVGLLVSPGELGGHGVDPVGAGVLMLGSLSWAIGSLYSRRGGLPRSPLLATGMEMLGGGALLLLAGTATGELGALDLGQVGARAWLSLGYLVVFGSLVGFTAYIWLLRVTTPSIATTYAYVNPIVAMLLGWALAGEAITGRTLVAMAVIVGAVVVLTTRRAAPPAAAAPLEEPLDSAPLVREAP